MNYGPDRDPRDRAGQARPRRDLGLCAQPRLSRHHQGQAEGARRRSCARAGGDVKVFVDTAPVMEKPLAEAAGLGWQGKHTNLVSREFGSWLFLGAIFTTAELPPDRAEAEHCGTCRACLDICPTNAFPGALPARCAALPLLPHHRAQGADPARIPRSDGQPHLWLRRLPRGLPVEQVRPGRRARRSSQARDDLRRAGARRAAAARRRGFPRLLRRLADQAHRPRPLPPQRADRRRQFRRCRAWPPAVRALARRCLAAGARRGGVGAVAAGAGCRIRRAWPRLA